MIDIRQIKDKFEQSVFDNLDKENVHKILNFLFEKRCDFIEDIVSDYIDLFTFNYDEFVIKYNQLNEKYDGNFLKKASEDMNLLEEFYS